MASKSRCACALLLLAVGGCSSSGDDAPASGDEQDVEAAAPLLTPPQAPRAARFPFVFVHAFNASSTNDWSFNGVKEALTKDGHFVVMADVSPFAGTPKRAEELVKIIDDARKDFCAAVHADQPADACLSATKVHLVGHSQGGLDARFAASNLHAGDRVASITTISSPHEGTPIGDVGFGVLKSERVDPLAEKLFAFIGFVRAPNDVEQTTNIRDAFFWLSEQRARDATFDMPDVDGVVYQSWAGVATLDGRPPADVSACEGGAVLAHAPRVAGEFGLSSSLFFVPLVPAFTRADQIPNDGHIPVRSARHGEFQGCIPGDHLDLIGRPADQTRAAQRRTGFDHVTLYRVIADRLAKRGL